MVLHLKSHENQNFMQCIMEGCSQKLFFLGGKNYPTYNVPSSLYEHLTKEHDVSMQTQTVCVDFKCKHCNTTLIAESSSPEMVTKFWFENARIWPAILAQHMTNNHQTLARDLDLKKYWALHYDKGPVSLKERMVGMENYEIRTGGHSSTRERAVPSKRKKTDKDSLKQILDTLKCNLCDFKASGSYVIRNNPLLKFA